MTQAIIVKKAGAYVVTAAGAEVVASLLAQARAISGDIQPVIDNIGNINAVAANETNINTVAARDAAIATVAARDAAIGTVAARDADIGTVAARDSDIGVVADDLNLGPSSLLAAAPDAISAVATVGLDTLNPASLGAIGGVDPNDTVTRRAAVKFFVPNKSLVANRIESAGLATMRYTVDVIGDSRAGGSGVVSAGAAVNARSGINGSMPRHLEYKLQQIDPRWRVVNRGVSGQRSHEIASRAGAVPMLITLVSGTTLPASGATACTATPGANGPSANRANSPDVYVGTIGSQACLLKAVENASANPKNYTIEQVGGTGDLTINPGTIFRLTDRALDLAVKVIWTGVNDPIDLYTTGDGLGLQMSKDMISAMVNALPVDERRYVIIGDTPFCGGTMDAGSSAHNNLLARNAWRADKFGPHFFDWHRWQRGEFPYDGSVYPSYFQMFGISPTDPTNDWVTTGDWVTLGRPPRRNVSIFKGGTDVNHPHEDHYWEVAEAIIALKFKQLGYV